MQMQVPPFLAFLFIQIPSLKAGLCSPDIPKPDPQATTREECIVPYQLPADRNRREGV